jgi:hypothetical protein
MEATKHDPVLGKHYPLLGGLLTKNVIVTKPATNRCWLIGPYDVLKKEVGTPLRSDVQLQREIGSAGIRLGERKSDDPPNQPWKRAIGNRGPAQPSEDYNLPGKRPNPSRPSVGPVQPARDTDQYPPVAAFWAARTPEAHHIIEDNIVKAMGHEWGTLKREYAPCVLLFAELHQHWITRVAQTFRPMFNATMTKSAIQTNLDRFIKDLYSTPAFQPIVPVAEVIRDVILARQ